jgi:hypothetical protein
MLATLLACGAWMILLWEDFAWYDDALFTSFSLRGVSLPPPIWPAFGRFFPLGLQEFNLMGHFTKTAVGYYALPIAEAVALAFLLLALDGRLSIAGRAVLAGFAFLTPGLVVSFTGLIYPERNVAFLLGGLALSVTRFERTHSVWWAVAAVLSAQVMLYLKEPVFLLLLGFAAARLVLRRRASHQAGRSVRWIWDEESRLDVCIAAVSAIFAAYYVIMMFPHSEVQYLAGKQASPLQAVRFYLVTDWLVWILLAVVVTRMYRIFRGTTAPEPCWDGLAIGGLVYFAAYLGLRLTHYYYPAPADLIAVLYLGRLLFASWGTMRPASRIAAAGLAALVVCHGLSLSALRVFEHKYVVRQKVAVANEILNRYHRDPASVRNLYFPFTGDYVLSEYAAYLRFRGLPVQEIGGDAAGDSSVEIFGSRIPRDGPCYPARVFLCHAGGPVNSGGLVVVLPDDVVRPNGTHVFLQPEQALRSFDLLAHIPQRLTPAWNRLRSWPRLWTTKLSTTVYVGVWTEQAGQPSGN